MTDQAPMRWQAAEIPLLLWRLPAREKVSYILRERENLPVSLSLNSLQIPLAPSPPPHLSAVPLLLSREYASV
jgi:hypothetical protein